eukprot:m.226868 g.226868  ORF g.226868 m.226868 type:complete len:505 (+) comp11496_c0_seq1:163-1677(+)
MAEPPLPNIVTPDSGPARQRASSAGQRLLSRRIRRSSGTYPLSPQSPESDESKPSTLYCVCRQPYNKKRNMVQCDRCDDWFHPECVGIVDLRALSNAPYYCPNCEAPPTSRPRSASSAPALEVPEGGRPRSYSNSRKRPKMPGSAGGPLTPGPSPLSASVEDTPSSLPRSSARPIKRESKDSPESMSLPNYLHTPYSLRTRHAPEPSDDDSGTGKYIRSRHRYMDDTDDADTELDMRYASPTESVLRARSRRRHNASVIPGMEALSIHSGDLNGGYIVQGCPNRMNPFHTCTSYCACRWGVVPSRPSDEPASRSPIFHDDADHKRVFHNERERVRRSTIRNMFESLRRCVPAVEAMDSTSDRHILVEAAQHIKSLTEEGRELERGVVQLRIENLRLRLSQVPADSSAAAALSAQLAAAMCAAEAVESNGHSLMMSSDDQSLPYGPAQRPDDSALADSLSPESVQSSSSGPSSDMRDMDQPAEACTDLETLLRVAEEEYAQAVVA